MFMYDDVYIIIMIICIMFIIIIVIISMIVVTVCIQSEVLPCVTARGLSRQMMRSLC